MTQTNRPPAQQDHIAALLALQEIAKDLTAELDLETLLDRVVEAAVKVIQVSAGSLLIWDAPNNDLVFAVAKGGGGPALVGRRMPAYKGIAGWVLSNQRPAIANSVRQDPRFFSAIDESLGYHTSSLLAVPLLVKGEAIGVLEVLNKISHEPFDQQEVDLLMALAGQAAVAQLLSAITMHLSYIDEIIKSDPEQAAQEIAQLKEIASKALQQIRSTIFELRPIILQTKGLIPALRTYVKRLREVEDMAIHDELEDWPERLPARIEEVCFSIIQEALTNIKKHAEANNAWLKVSCQDDRLITTVRDDGKGFAVSRLETLEAQEGHLGLVSMRERAEMVNGELAIRSQPGWGTRVTLAIPLSESQTNDRPRDTDYLRRAEEGSPTAQRETGKT
jgi:two-component sensor histidine kinase